MAKRPKNRYQGSRTKPTKARNAAARSQTGPLPHLWPALPIPKFSQAMSIFSQMNFIEKMPPDQQKCLQLRQIERVLRHACATVPYYRDKLNGIDRIPDGDLDEIFFAGIPILSRSDIQSGTTALRSNNVPPELGRVGLIRSSGSTGKPIEVATNQFSVAYSLAMSLRAHYWHGRDASLKSVDIRTAYKPGSEPKNPTWSVLPWAGPNHRLDLNLPITKLFEQFIAEDPAYVHSHPYTLMLLAERSRETGIVPRNLIEARSFGEALSPKIRQVLREVWGVPVTDNYSAMEIGTMAHQCPDNENLHVQVENVRIEVLDDDGAPCRPGTIGRVVVTTLNNFATPLIRYENGDYAEVGTPCSCGRTLPVLSRILGRHRNLCVLKNGERFFPEIRESLERFKHIRQFQAHQKTVEDIDLKVVATRPFSDEERKEIQAILQKKLNYPFNVNIIEVEDIPRAANGKFEEFKSDIPGAEIDS
jgi:phenylacetate-CoA ligase